MEEEEGPTGTGRAQAAPRARPSAGSEEVQQAATVRVLCVYLFVAKCVVKVVAVICGVVCMVVDCVRVAGSIGL